MASLRGNIERMRDGQVRRRPAILIFGGILLVLFVLILVQAIRSSKQHGQIIGLTVTQLRFERSIGYGGFIHNFKNAVLRPHEPHYLEAASRQFDELMLVFDELDKKLASAGVFAATGAIRSTFSRYGDKLHLLREQGEIPSARELDSKVRVPDDQALLKLQQHLDQVSTRLKNEYQHSTTLMFLSLAFGALTFIGIVLVLLKSARTREHMVADRIRAELLQQENHELDVANADLRSFSYALSHDLKSPTNTARMILRELREYPEGHLGEQDHDFLNKADLQLMRIQKLIGDVLNYTRIVGQKSNEHELVNLNQMMSEVLSDLEADINEAKAQVNVAQAMPSLWGHPMQIRLLLQNLVSNAIRYRHQTKSCVVNVRASNSLDGQTIEIQVQDNGPGIPREYQTKIFEMFQRIDKRANISGTGLGLALCRRVASNHGGHIAVASDCSNPGSVFSVTLLHQFQGAM